MKRARTPEKKKPGRPKNPALDIVDLGELKRKVKEIKKRKKGLYLKHVTKTRHQGSEELSEISE